MTADVMQMSDGPTILEMDQAVVEFVTNTTNTYDQGILLSLIHI